MTSKPRKSRENDRVFVDHVLELLGEWGEIKARSMFGGFGLYRHAVMFALIADGVLYLKADDTTRPLFEAEGSRPFTYTRQGRSTPIVMSYMEAPVEALERGTLLAQWAERAYAVAVRAQSAKRR